MSSIRDQILSAIVSALNGAGKPAGVTVRRFSTQTIEPSALPLIEVYPGKDTVRDVPKGMQLTKRTLVVMLDVYGQESEAATMDEALDPALCWVTAALQKDQSLGGLALEVRDKDAEWDAEQASQGTALCKVLVEVDYIHNRANQENKT